MVEASRTDCRGGVDLRTDRARWTDSAYVGVIVIALGTLGLGEVSATELSRLTGLALGWSGPPVEVSASHTVSSGGVG